MTHTADGAPSAFLIRPDTDRLTVGLGSGVYVAGTWRDAGATSAVVDPATGESFAEVVDATPEDGRAALDAAVAAQSDWAAQTPRRRADVLRAAYDLVCAQEDDLAMLITLEMGKPLAESRGEVRYAAEFLRWFSEEAVRIAGRWSVAPAGGARILTMQQPVGPCLMVTPWNFPLAMGARKIAPAVAAGCTMVVKPAPQTPLTMVRLVQLLEEAGLPPGVCNMVTTTRAEELVTPLLADPRLRKLTFTGSTQVGRALAARAGSALLRQSMELGGNAAFLVLEDADLEQAVEGAMVAKMRNVGQACTAANRFVVHRSRAAEFAAALTERMAAQVVGPGYEKGVDVGPLIDDRQRSRVAALVEDALAAGAVCATGGAVPRPAGYFYAPTVLTDVPGDAAVLREEVFGPVAPVTTVGSDDEAIATANASPYGLTAYVFTRDLNRALSAVERLETGMVAVNKGVISEVAAPFGGIKASGFGREGGVEGIGEYLSTKYAGVAL